MDALAPGLAKTAHGPIVSFANLTMKTLLLTLVALYQKPIAARQKASVEGLEARLTGKVVTMPVRESARNSPFASKWALIRKDLMVFAISTYTAIPPARAID